MTKRLAVGALLFLLAACGGEQPSGSSLANTDVETKPQPEPVARPRPAPRENLPEGPSGPTSAQGAATVVETYYALIEARQYAEALKLRWDGESIGLDRFAANFEPYSEYRATVGAPSEIQGAAGSLFVEVPVQLYGRMKDGKPFGSVGNITLRRVNDVPGSTPAHRRWRIYTSE